MQNAPKADDKNYSRIISTQQSVISSVLSTAMKIGEARLQKGKKDQFEEILALIKHEQDKSKS